ncbi:unnamed protein product, partial [Musa textilis]
INCLQHHNCSTYSCCGTVFLDVVCVVYVDLYLRLVLLMHLPSF